MEWNKEERLAMIFVLESIVWAGIFLLAFVAVTLPVTIPLALWLHLYEKAGGGP